jgi:hypothetical protein
MDSMLIVVRAGLVRRRSLAELHRLLDTAPAAKLGFVLTGADLEDDYDYGGGYGSNETSPLRSQGRPLKALRARPHSESEHACGLRAHLDG